MIDVARAQSQSSVHRTSKTILSADDIVRARERQRRLAVLGGKRPDGGTVESHAAKRARWEAAATAGFAPMAAETLRVGLDAMVPTCAWTEVLEVAGTVAVHDAPHSPEAAMQAARDGQSVPSVDGQEAQGAL